MKPMYVNPARTYLTDEQKEKLVKFGLENDMKVSDILREALEEFLEKHSEQGEN